MCESVHQGISFDQDSDSVSFCVRRSEILPFEIIMFYCFLMEQLTVKVSGG